MLVDIDELCPGSLFGGSRLIAVNYCATRAFCFPSGYACRSVILFVGVGLTNHTNVLLLNSIKSIADFAFTARDLVDLGDLQCTAARSGGALTAKKYHHHQGSMFIINEGN